MSARASHLWMTSTQMSWACARRTWFWACDQEFKLWSGSYSATPDRRYMCWAQVTCTDSPHSSRLHGPPHLLHCTTTHTGMKQHQHTEREREKTQTQSATVDWFLPAVESQCAPQPAPRTAPKQRAQTRVWRIVGSIVGKVLKTFTISVH